MAKADDLELGKGSGVEGDPDSGDKKTEKPAFEFAPGVLTAAEVNALAPPVKVNDTEVTAIKGLNRKTAMRDMPSRREQIIRIWEQRLFDRGFQHLLPRNNGGWELPAVGSGYGPGEEEDRSQWEIEIYSSYRKIICAALTREVPGNRFEPSDPDNDRDINAASKAEKAKTKIERDNRMKELQGEAARFLWTDGVAVHFTRYLLDAQAFGYEPEPEGDVPEDEDTGKAATELEPVDESAEGSEGDHGSDVDEEPNELSEGADESGAEGGDHDSDDTEEADESGSESQGTPRGHEVITVLGALNWKLPIKANCLAEMPYARCCWEQDVSTVRAAWPDKADEITPSRSGSDGGSGGDDLERLARVNVMLGVEDNFITEDSSVYDVTMMKTWYRPGALMEIEDDATRIGLMKKFPKGLYITMAGEVFLEARNASMDNYLAITFADAGDGVHRPSLGQPLVAPQKILNTLAELAYEYFVHGVPMTYMDDEMFDIEAIRDQDNLVGGIRPFEATGNQIDGIFWFREQPVPFPEQLLTFLQWIMDEVAQLMSGAYPALFGGDMTNQGVGDALMQRDQALGRLGLVWRNIKGTSAIVIRQAVQSIAQNGKGSLKLGGVEKTNIDIEDLKGNILCFPDTDENIPESWTQKSNRFEKIIEGAATNPFFAKLLDDPSNLRLVKDMSGFKDLSIPMLESFEKQLGELAILMRTGPAPNPAITELEEQIKQLTARAQTLQPVAPPALLPQVGQPAPVAPVVPPVPPPELVAMQQQIAQLTQQAQQLQQTTPLVSTYPIDFECDDHETEALTCLRFINGPRGRAMKNGTDEDMKAFANIRLHFMEHTAADEKKKAAAAQKAATLPKKPPSLSANVKDLPAKEAAEVLAQAGIQSDPKDFEAQDAAEAVAKHPTALAQ